MGSSRCRAALAAGLGTLVLLAAANAPADDSKVEAKRHFEAGLALAEAEDFPAAAVEFESSVALFPTKMGLFNLANCYKALHRYAEALDTIVRLKNSFAGKLGADLEREVIDFERSITALVGRLRVKADPAGAVILVDGKIAGEAPLAEPLLLGPGDHEVRVEAKGHRPETRKVRVTSRGSEEIIVELSPLPAAAGGQAPPSPGEDPGDPEPSVEDGGKKLGPGALITAGVLAAGFGAATIGLGVKAGQLEQDAVDAGDQGLMDEAGTLQTAGRVMLGLTGAALATAAVLAFFTDFRGSESQADEGASLRSPRSLPSLESASIWACDGGGGIALSGRF
jgi:hypothetical protein